MIPAFNPSTEAKERQQAVVLAALRVKRTGTIEFREVHGIAHPSGRVMELRRLGHVIDTLSLTVLDDKGRPHRSAVYVLKERRAEPVIDVLATVVPDDKTRDSPVYVVAVQP